MALAQEAPLLRWRHGPVMPLDVERWMEEPNPVELEVLRHGEGPVLDVGCGPGRLVLALGRIGVLALGLETAPSAVQAGRQRGAMILERSVFATVPGAGRWGTALLFDGNIGIGGCPGTLLRRLRGLLRPTGLVLVELDPPGPGLLEGRARIEAGPDATDWFPWARVDPRAIEPVAADAGFTVEWLRAAAQRWFAALRSGR